MNDFPEMMTVKETAAFMRCSVRSIYDQLSRGSIPGIKNGHTWRIPKSELIALSRKNLREREVKGGE